MIRFSTVAANADVLGEDTPLTTDEAPGGQRAPARPSADRPEHRRGRQPKAPRPGQDINAPGFIKDPSGNKPS